jgi:hypothetical protein
VRPTLKSIAPAPAATPENESVSLDDIEIDLAD